MTTFGEAERIMTNKQNKKDVVESPLVMAKLPTGVDEEVAYQAAALMGNIAAKSLLKTTNEDQVYMLLMDCTESAEQLWGLRIYLGKRWLRFTCGDQGTDRTNKEFWCRKIQCSCKNMQECFEKRCAFNNANSTQVQKLSVETLTTHNLIMKHSKSAGNDER